jgi:hypothetical protein
MRLAHDIELVRPPPAKELDQAYSTLELTVLLLLCVTAWALSHSYRGIFHDAGLYTLQALARLAPASLGQDVFLRFGSQDRYTIFSPIYAAASQVLGTEAAAGTREDARANPLMLHQPKSTDRPHMASTDGRRIGAGQLSVRRATTMTRRGKVRTRYRPRECLRYYMMVLAQGIEP